MAIGIGRVRPDDAAALVELVAGRLDEVGAAVDRYALGREASLEQVAACVEEPDVVAMGGQVHRTPVGARHHGLVYPDTLAARRVETAKLAIAIDAVDLFADEQWGGDRRMQAVGFLFGSADALPDLSRR